MTVWFITGASRGFGIEIAREALRRGDRGVATARTPGIVRHALPDAGDALLALPLDVTDEAAAASAVDSAVAHFGRIDVLVNTTRGASTAGPTWTSCRRRTLLRACSLLDEDNDSDPTFVDVDVPVQDLRAIRRAVLDLSEFDRSGQTELTPQPQGESRVSRAGI